MTQDEEQGLRGLLGQVSVVTGNRKHPPVDPFWHNRQEQPPPPTFFAEQKIRSLESQNQELLGELAREKAAHKKVAAEFGAFVKQALEDQRMRREPIAVLQVTLSAVGEVLRKLEWRKRSVDSELECPICRVLKSAFGGNHPPRCEMGKALELTKMSREARAFVFQTLKPGPQVT